MIDTEIIIKKEKISTDNNYNTVYLRRNTSYNPFYVAYGDKTFLLEQIVFYDKTGVKGHTRSGWFDTDNNHLFSVTFITKKALRRKTKVNLSQDEPFFIKSDCNWDIRYVLYIPISDLPKFEISYCRVGNFIIKNIDIGVSDCPVKETVKYIDKTSDIAMKLEEAVTVFSSYNIRRWTTQQFDETIGGIYRIWNRLQEAKEEDSNYTVKDFLKEYNITDYVEKPKGE